MTPQIQSIFAFFIIQNGQEQIMVGSVSGQMIPLVYLSHEALQYEKMVPYVTEYANKNNAYIELREYVLVPQSVEKFYPSKSNCDA